MSVNLLNMVTDALGGGFASQLGGYLGESESTTKSAVATLLPALLNGIAQKGSTSEGAASLMSLLSGQNVNASWLSNIGAWLAPGHSTANAVLASGGPILSMLFGDKVGNLANTIGAMAGLRGSSAGSLLQMVAPLAMSVLARHVSTNGMNAGGLQAMLGEQKSALAGMLDSRLAGLLGLGSVITGAASAAGTAAATGVNAVGGAAAGAATTAINTASAAGGGLMRWLPWIIGAAILLWLFKSCAGGTQKAEAPALPATSPTPIEAPKVASAPAAAPAAPAATAMPAVLKVYFDTGKSDPPGEIGSELKPIIEYLKANTSVRAKLSGFHDKTGDPEKNAELAKNRALTIRSQLQQAGISEDRVILERPVETTGGADDREARRVEISVVQ